MTLKEKIQNKFIEYNIEITENQAEMLEKFNYLMIDYNKTHNITNITEENDVLIKHLLDSILPIKLFKNNSKIIDIGCGAGYPSIPLAILNPDLNITAIDSAGKKVNFVQMVTKELNLTNLTAIHTRIEDLARKIEYREQYDYVVSRAVAPMPILIEYSIPFLKNNGQMYSYKGINYNSELENSKNALNKLNSKFTEAKEYYIKELDSYRYIVIIKKLKDTSKTYPRAGNKPRLQPL